MYQQYTSTKWFCVPIYIFNIIVGTTANFLIMLIYSRAGHEFKKDSYNYILTHLAGANLILSLIFNPILLAYRIEPQANVIAGGAVCAAGLLTSILALSMVFACLPLLALHRNDAHLNHNGTTNNKLTKAKAKVYVWTFWAISITFSISYVLLVLLDSRNAPLAIKRDRCLLASYGINRMTLAFLIYAGVLMALPIVLSIFYLLGPLFSISVAGSINATRTKLTLLLLAGSTIVWTPFGVIQAFGIFAYYSELLFNLHACVAAVGLLWSSVSPILIMITDTYFVIEFRKMCSHITVMT